MKGKRVISALCGVAMLLTGFGLTSTTAVADDGKLDQQIATQDVEGSDSQQDSRDAKGATTNSGDDSSQEGSSVEDKTPDTEDQGITPFKSKGQAAPDVAIHDMLDTDTATVSKLKLTGWTTGTAPFDKDNGPGDDKDDNNAIVRSYDTVTYDYDYTLTPDDAMTYYRKARVGFRFELPYPADKVTFATDQMNWVDRTPGYEAKVTQEGDRQVFTAYRLLTPTSNSPTVCPGTSGITLAVKVLGAPNGYRFHPTVKAWTVPNDTSNRIVSDTPKDVTVSAKLNLNVRMVDYGNVDRGVFDFSSGAANAPNRTEGKVTGLGLGIALVTEMRWPDRTKGLKGLEAPSGRITYRLRLSNQYSDDTKTGTKHPMERRWQPLLYDYGHIDNEDSKYGRTFAWMGDLPRRGTPGVADHADGYDKVARGNTTVTTTTGGQGTDVTVSFDGYDTSVLPIHNLNPDSQHKCSTDYMTSDCSTMQVGAIHTDVLQFVTPTSRDGRTVAQYYGNVDQTANITMDDMGLTATSVSGDRLATAEDNSNQASTGDDHAGSALTVRIPGTYSTRTRYTYWNNSGWNDAGTSGHWVNPDYSNGSDSLVQGSKLRLQIGHNIKINSEGDAEVMGMGLVKFDPNTIEPVDNTPDTQPTIPIYVWTWGARAAKRKNAIPYWYAVKKDGTNWKDYKEQRDTKISGLDYYPTLNEAKTHGTIVGMLFEDHNTVDPANTTFSRNFTSSVSLPAHILDTARIGTVTPIVAETAYWTRGTLTRVANLNVDASNTQWQQWSDNLTTRLPEYANSVTPNLTYSGDTYRPATFDENGVYQGGDTADTLKGDSLYVAGETPHIAKQVAQTNEAGNTKTVYDLDKEQRTVDWRLTATADTSTTTDGGQYTTDYIITDTLPKGLTYVDGSMTVGGQYTQHTPDKGTVTGGTPVTPTIVANKDGTTTMTIRVNGARADSGTQIVIHYSTTIGDSSDPDHDAKNNDSFTNHVAIQSKRNMAPPLAPKAQIADYTIRVSRTRATSLATRAQPLLNDIERPLGFRNMLGNFSKDEKTNPYAVDVMPYKGLNQSNYHGDYTLSGLTVKAGAGASMVGVKVYFTTDQKWRNVDATKITREQVQQWTEATVNATTGKVAIPDGYSRPVAWAFTSPSLPANARYDFTLSIKPTNNSAGDVYMNRWADGDNKVDAVTQVVERKVNGVAWFDRNHDGVREDTDRLLPDVNVTLVDGNGRTVTSVNGKPCTTTTDRNGHYEIGSIPAGSGFKLRFTPTAGTAWHGQHTTVKNAKEASEATDSDSDQENDSHGNMVAGVITLKPFPALDEMTSAVYEDPNEDHGMWGKLTVQTANIPVRKTLEGKDIDNWQHSSDYDDTYTVEVKPVDGAPAEGIKTPIRLSDDKAYNLEVNGEAFPHEGDFKYEITEKRGSLKGVTYDPQVYELTVHVADDLNTLTRTITSSSSSKGANERNTETVLHNVYTPAPTQLHMTARKVLENSPHALQAGEFSFGLYEADTRKRLQTKTNDANGEVTFDDIAYDKAGLYRYYILEDKGTEPGITYNTTAKSAVVNVMDDHKGSLRARVLYDGKAEEPVINNTYSSKQVSVNIQAHKNLTGRDLKAGEFTFQLLDGKNKEVSEATNDSAGVATFPAVTFDKVGVYNYTVKEKIGNLPHVTYDKGIRNVTLTVTNDGNGNLVAHTDYGEGATSAEFNNTYTPENLTASFKATKHLTGKALRNGQFQFELVDPNGQVAQTKSNGDEGRVLFDPIKFTAAGDYVYHIREKIPAEPNGIQYDTTDHQVVAHVRVNEHTGDLSMTVEYQTAGDNETTGAVFTNVYSAQATWGIHGTKTLTGRDMQAGEFKFYLKDGGGNKVAETTVDAGADGQSVAYQFPDVTKTTSEMDVDVAQGIAYKTATGYVYNYTVEEDESKLGSGVSAKTAVQTVEVVITDNGNGTMTVTQNKGTIQKPVAFVNDYSENDATVQIAGKKKLTSDSQGVNLATISGKFHFTISAATDGAPLPVQTDVTNQIDGTVDFGQITYKQGILGGAKQKVFRYQVRESGSVEGITNDTERTKVFSVTVRDNGKGALVATSDKALGELFEFTNHYTSNGAEVPVNVTKTLTGKSLKKGEFTFQVKSADGTVLLEGTNGKNAASGEASTSEIGKLRFLREGSYTYSVVEKNIGEQGITYDTSKYQFTVVVANDGKGNLQASVHGQDGASGTAVHASFRNAYKPAPVEVGIRSSKTLVGRDMKAGEFNFILKNAIGETVKTISNTAAKDGKSSVLDFGKLSFDPDRFEGDVDMGLAVPDAQGGYTYGYSISEDKSNLPEGITAPSKVAFSVRVSDAGNGKLKAEVTSGGQMVNQNNGIATVDGLTNRYTEKNKPLTVSLRGIKTLSVGEGLTKPDITGKFHFALSGSEGAPMPNKRSVTNDANGNVVFGDVTFNSTDFKEGEAKAFTYAVRETGSVEGVTNDSESTKTFTVNVVRRNGRLSADLADTAFDFVNRYTATPVQVEIGGDKTLTGRSQKAGEFSFNLKSDKGETVATATTSADAKDGEASGFKFPAQTFTKPGVYNYLVSEESGSKGGVTYDTTVYKVQVKVTDNGKGALQAKVVYTDGQKGIHFKNTYKPAPETIAMDIAKTFNGRDMLGDESFKIKVEGGKSNPGGAELKALELLFQNLKSGDKAVTPDYVTFTKPGTYGYFISEESGNAVGVTYDKSVYRVKYVVTDDGNGHLVVKTFFGKDKGKDKLPEFKPAEGIQRPAAEFVNTYTPIKHNSIDVEKYDEKSGLQAGDRDDPKDALTANGDTTIDIKVTNTGDETLTGLTVKDKTVEGSGALGEIKLPQTTLKPGESIVVSAQLTGINAGDSHRDTVTVTGKTPDGTTVTDKDDWNGKCSIIPVLPSLAQTGASVIVLGLFALAAAGLGFALVKLRKVKASTGKHSK